MIIRGSRSGRSARTPSSTPSATVDFVRRKPTGRANVEYSSRLFTGSKRAADPRGVLTGRDAPRSHGRGCKATCGRPTMWAFPPPEPRMRSNVDKRKNSSTCSPARSRLVCLVADAVGKAAPAGAGRHAELSPERSYKHPVTLEAAGDDT